MDDSLRDVIHTVSKTLCGARLRLTVANLEPTPAYVRREMQILQQPGTITPQPPAHTRDVRRFYQAEYTNPLWGDHRHYPDRLRRTRPNGR